ncbi:HAD family hydrolase [Amphibacillus cookii]|uniref:HAD family hydrolase n=1 Tax=Amphibacillus cookii TaxID=767787 RepID=UPI00195616A6|nr:HAD family hydrolase [Amphibacillus cookii]MBM7541989.1 HAD superfamily hydrolase (TIGR01509 family) [Amphibacillus cookii]
MKAIIFDFDGTLADTLPVCYQAFQHVFQRYDDRLLSNQEIRAMFGPSETGIIRENLKDERKQEAITLFYQQYKAHHNRLVKPNADIQMMLSLLQDKGIKLAIVTGKARQSFEISVDALGLDYDFQAVITGDDVRHAKPDPEGIEKALKIMGVEAAEAIYLGDSNADIEAGKRAGVRTIGVQWLTESQTSAFSITPDAIYTSVQSFIDDLKLT